MINNSSQPFKVSAKFYETIELFFNWSGKASKRLNFLLFFRIEIEVPIQVKI